MIRVLLAVLNLIVYDVIALDVYLVVVGFWGVSGWV